MMIGGGSAAWARQGAPQNDPSAIDPDGTCEDGNAFVSGLKTVAQFLSY